MFSKRYESNNFDAHGENQAGWKSFRKTVTNWLEFQKNCERRNYLKKKKNQNPQKTTQKIITFYP